MTDTPGRPLVKKSTLLRTTMALAVMSMPGPLLAKSVTADPSPRRPNVIIILTDDQGYGDSRLHGNKQIDTPNIDRIATQGTEFNRFYVNALCSPTRAALLTGRDAYRTGVVQTSRGGSLMRPDEVTLAEALKGAGYRTGLFGKWHLGDTYPLRAIDQGFETAVNIKSGGINQTPDKPNSNFDPILYRDGKQFKAKGYTTNIFFDEAIRFVEQNKDQPFFAYIATNAPHSPLEVDDKYVEPFRKQGLDDQTAKTYAMLKVVDEGVGRLSTRVRQLGLDRDTILIFMSDNGPAGGRFNSGLRAGKLSAYEGGIRANFFIRWPSHVAQKRKVETIGAHVDVLP